MLMKNKSTNVDNDRLAHSAKVYWRRPQLCWVENKFTRLDSVYCHTNQKVGWKESLRRRCNTCVCVYLFVRKGERERERE